MLTVNGSSTIPFSALYINAGLLDPLEVCRRVERAYYDGHAPLNAAEGFIRQIIGWREYVRGIYWHEDAGLYRRRIFWRPTAVCPNSTGPARRTWRAWPQRSGRPGMKPMHTTSSG